MISIIIPVYNGSRFLEQTIISAIKQTYTDIEILLIEDCSTDNTLEIAEMLSEKFSAITLLKNQKNIGVAKSRNRGIEIAKGEYIAFLDSDDLWQPQKLEKQINLLKKSNADLCYTAYSFVNEYTQPIKKTYLVPEAVTLKKLLSENVIGLSTVLIKKSAVKQTRMTNKFAHEDYVFWLGLLKNGCKAIGINEPLMQYRLSDQNRSGNKKRAAQSRWRIYRDFMQMNILSSACYFVSYVLHGIIKYL